MSQIKTVVFGGGKGCVQVIKALKYVRDLKGRRLWEGIRAVISMSDDGGSTGRIADDQDVSPWGDIRRVLLALSPEDTVAADLFNFRFDDQPDRREHHLIGFGKHKLDLSDEAVGNIIMAALEKDTGDPEEAIRRAARLLGTRGVVYPCSLDRLVLVAELENGSKIWGQSKISHSDTEKVKIARVWLEFPDEDKGCPIANRHAVNSIGDADLIIIPPGALHASILASMMVPGIAAAVKESSAYKVFFLNTAVRLPETHGFGPEDHIRAVLNHIQGLQIDLVVANNNSIGVPEAIELLTWDQDTMCDIPVMKADLIDDSDVAGGSYFLHNPDKIRAILPEILERSERR